MTTLTSDHDAIARPALPRDIPRIAAVNLESWRFAYGGIVPEAHFERLTSEVCELHWRKILASASIHSYVLESVGDGTIVGVAAADPGGFTPPDSEKRSAELLALYLLPSHTRRGLGRLLLGAVARRVKEAGADSLGAWVVEQNPCRRFYEKMGAEVIGRKEDDMGGFVVSKIAYVWNDIETLIRRT